MMSLKQRVKPFTPLLLRKVYRAVLSYFQRIFRWVVILTEIRGITIVDQIKLLTSAFLSPITSLKNILQWQNPVLFFNTSLKVFIYVLFNVRAFSDDLWHILPWRESSIFKVIKTKLAKGSIFVDAGANIGAYTVLASSLIGEKGKVIAIEMIPTTSTILKQHIDINQCDNVTIKNVALSSHPNQTVSAFVPNNKYGMASISNSHKTQNIEEIKVKTDTLDNILEPYSHIDLLKLDIEGAELLALFGCIKSIDKIESIIFESHTQSRAITRFLEDRGFNVSSLSSRDMIAEKI